MLDSNGDWGNQGSWGTFSNRPGYYRENEWREHPIPDYGECWYDPEDQENEGTGTWAQS
jgi:hypothetical protein